MGWQDILNMSVLFVAVVCSYYLAGVKSYIKEKGKSLATKEDLEEVTKTVENIKGEITVLTQRQIGLSAAKQQMIVEFTTKYSAFLHTVVITRFYEHNLDAATYHEGMKEKINEVLHPYLGADANMEVFFADDKELINLKGIVRNETVQIMNLVTTALNTFRMAGENIERLQKRKGEWKTEADAQPAIDAINKRVADLRVVSAERDALHVKLEPYKEELYKLFHDRIVDFQKN